MAPYKRTFSTGGDPVVASVDFYDFATGTGFKDFYFMDNITGAGTQGHILTPNASYYSTTGFTSVTDPAELDVDFDIDLEIPFTLEGEAVFNVFFASGQAYSASVEVNIKRVTSTGTEIQVGTEVSETITWNNDTKVFSGKYTIPKTSFKAGEKIRVIVSSGSLGGGGRTLRVLHDPKDRDVSGTGTFLSSLSKISLPVNLQL